MAKDEKKADVLNTFFTPVFCSRTICSLDTHPPKLEGKDGEQNEAPVI